MTLSTLAASGHLPVGGSAEATDIVRKVWIISWGGTLKLAVSNPLSATHVGMTEALLRTVLDGRHGHTATERSHGRVYVSIMGPIALEIRRASHGALRDSVAPPHLKNITALL